MRNIISKTTRKTLTKMEKENLERSSIAKVTGHRNTQSLDDYDEADEHEQRQLSWAISERNSAVVHPVLLLQVQ